MFIFVKKLRGFILAPLVFVLLGASCLRAPSQEAAEASKPVTLTWWTVYTDSSALQPVISAYHAAHPNVNINIKTLRYGEYEQQLLNALAEDRGPDIFSIHNTWGRAYQNKLSPLPESYTLPFTTIEGTVKKEKVTRLANVNGMTIRELTNSFVSVVPSDVIMREPGVEQYQQGKERIYGLPLSGDNLALFYNKNLLDAAGIAEPPRYWDDFQTAVKRLTRQDAQGNLIQSGVGMGTAKNVPRYADILSLLMMQNGTHMVNEEGNVWFDRIPNELSGRESAPGADAVVFYTDFANPSKEVYTWNNRQQNALDAFASGKTAFFLGYAFNLSDIRARGPKLNFGVAPAPQIKDNTPVNYANYWVEGVSKKSAHQNWAWDFLQFAAKEPQNNIYLTAAKKPTALRGSLKNQENDLDLSVFASQMLTAKSWYHGKNEAAYETAFADLITNVLGGALLREAMQNAVNQVSETFR